jgi:hypothetical protein
LRLRWITGWKLPEPVWLVIGVLLFAIGVAIALFPFYAMWKSGQSFGRRGRATGPIVVVLVGGTLMTIGSVEVREAVARLRGRGGVD